MRVWLLLILCLLYANAHAQEVLQGMVIDSASFQPLPYITVEIKNKNKGTITDNDGAFRIVASHSDTLVFRSVSYNRLELPAIDWDNNIVLLSEKVTMLNTLTIRDSMYDPNYEELFREENEAWKRNNKSLPFYYSRSKKQKIRVGRLESENIRVKTYVDVIIKNEENKIRLIKEYNLSETEYYDILSGFNASNYQVMYYLSAPELITLLNNYFAAHKKR